MKTNYKIISIILWVIVVLNYFIYKANQKQTTETINNLQYNLSQKDTIIGLLEQLSYKRDSLCKATHTKKTNQ